MMDSEWRNWRTKGIGGTDAAAIAGLDKYRSPLQVYLDKIGQGTPFEGNEHTRRGHLLEQAVANWFVQETGFPVDKGAPYENLDNSILRGTPDFIYASEHGKFGVLECKTTLKKMNGEPDTKWYAQLQWYLGITNASSGSIAWMESGYQFFYVTFERNDEFIAGLQNVCLDFWNNNVLVAMPPPPRTIADIELLFPREITGKSIEAVDYVANLVNEYKSVSAELKELELRKEELSEQIKLSFTDAESLTYGNEIIATYKAPKDSSIIDGKKLLAEMPEIYHQYSTIKNSTRILRIK